MKVIEKTINILTKDSAPDSIKQLAKLSKKAATCVRSQGEPMSTYIDRFFHPAQTCFNLTNSGHASTESQNFAMILLSNTILSQKSF